MKLREALNLYSLHSNPEQLDKYDQAQVEFKKHPGKCVYRVGDVDDKAEVIEGGLVECLSQVLIESAVDRVYPYTKSQIAEIIMDDFNGMSEQQVRAEVEAELNQARQTPSSHSEADLNRMSAYVIKSRIKSYRKAIKHLELFNSIDAKTLIIQFSDDGDNLIALTQPVDIVQSRLNFAKELR